jgi:hypothetical protein
MYNQREKQPDTSLQIAVKADGLNEALYIGFSERRQSPLQGSPRTRRGNRRRSLYARIGASRQAAAGGERQPNEVADKTDRRDRGWRTGGWAIGHSGKGNVETTPSAITRQYGVVTDVRPSRRV